MNRARVMRVAARVEAWFAANARPLPWRVQPRDPYRALVSELMLQQTQVSRVVERFGRFVERFPTVESLAGANEHEVLAEWAGLGYYRRARLLHAAAGAIVARFGGRVPAEVESLRTLPGVGRYTAGAVASMVFGGREAIVDGNVARVIMRIEGKEGRHQNAEAMSWAWDRSAELVAVATEPGVLNEGLMELGATVCTPRSPRCGVCPLARLCIARRKGRQEEIPRPKAAAVRQPVHCATALVRDGRGRVLVRRRPPAGLWAGMWEAPTVESARRISRGDVRGMGVVPRRRASSSFEFATTHRTLRFDVWEASVNGIRPPGSMWKTRAELARLPMSSPQRRILLGITRSVS